MAQVHDLSLDLRPPMLDDLGLLPTLLWHFGHYTTQTGVRVIIKHRGVKNRRFAARIEMAAYRIVQEALTNVARHAEVPEATVLVSAFDKALRLQIIDQGHGFDPAAALAASDRSGLAGMRERAALLGGYLEIRSAVGAGTSLKAEFPIAQTQ
jgi:signal transduction histidine kinase